MLLYSQIMSTITEHAPHEFPALAVPNILRDEAYFLAHRQELMRLYEGQFVAVRGERVVTSAPSRRTVHAQLRAMYQGEVYALVREVCPESFIAPVEPTYLAI
jgi:hypothetical protein